MIRYALAPETFKLVYGSYQQFHPSQLDGMPQTLSLCTARRMSAAFQLLLCADEAWVLQVGKGLWLSQKGELLCVRAEASCTAADGSARFPGAVSLQIEGMHRDDDGYFRADALLEQETAEQSAGEARAVYAEITLPDGAPAGEYRVTLRLLASRMFEDETPVGEATVLLTVYPVDMHGSAENKFYLDLWQHPCNIARKHGVPLWSDAHFAVLEPYIRSLAELGQRAVTLVVTEAPWGGQSCFREYRTAANLFEYSVIPLKKTRDGELVPDFRPMQRYIDLCAKYGIRDELSLYGLMNVWCVGDTGFGRLAPDDPDALRVRYYDESDGSFRFLRTEAELETYIAAIGRYFRETGQMERVRVAADEPADPEKYRASLARLRRIEPEFRFKAAINHAEFIEEFGQDISDFVPYSSHLFTHLRLLQEYRRRMPEKRFLWYVCCGPVWPNTFLRSDLCETLFLGVMTSWCRMDGFLRWSYTVWNDDPRTDCRYGDFPAGDTHFVYPSSSGGPLLTLRWKALRKAIRLYELLELLRAEQGDGAADAMILTVLKNTETEKYYTDGHWRDDVMSCDPADYERLLRGVLEQLSSKNR